MVVIGESMAVNGRVDRMEQWLGRCWTKVSVWL